MSKAQLASVALTAGALLGCSPSSTPAPQPLQVMKDSFVGCIWEKVEGKSLSIWSFNCEPRGATRLVADDALPGFRIVGGPVAIMAFDKPADAPITVILSQVRAASPGPHSDTCELTLLHPVNQSGQSPLYMFEPTGAAKAEWDAWEANVNHVGDLQPPCGIMGPALSGDRYFQTMTDHPATVVFVELGSEIQIFDIKTLRHK